MALENPYDFPGVNVKQNTLANLAQVKLNAYTFATLPASPTVGTIAYVSDSNTVVWGANVAGGGANKILAWYNGTNWTVVGK